MDITILKFSCIYSPRVFETVIKINYLILLEKFSPSSINFSTSKIFYCLPDIIDFNICTLPTRISIQTYDPPGIRE